MPGIEHEAAVQLILNNPRVLEALLATGGVVVPPDKDPEIADSNLSVREPDEFHAELVTVHTVMGHKLAIVVEVQTDPPKPAKRRDWPAYLTVAGRRHACDAALVVIALKPETARASRKLIQTGHPGFGLTPIVVAFDNSPLSWSAGPNPELLLIAVLTGRLDLSDHETQMLILTVLRTLNQTDLVSFESYTRLIRHLASPEARNELRELMKITFPRDDFIDGWIEVGIEQGIAQGEPRGEAKMLLRVLTSRGFEIPDDIWDTVLSCTDTSQLETWGDLAATASSIDEIFKR